MAAACTIVVLLSAAMRSSRASKERTHAGADGADDGGPTTNIPEDPRIIRMVIDTLTSPLLD